MKYLFILFCLVLITSCQWTPEQWEEFNQGMSDLEESLGESNAILNGRNSYYGNRTSQSGNLNRDYVSGFNKICIYDGVSGEFAKTISSTSLCPLSAKQDSISEFAKGQSGFLERDYVSGFNKICVYV